MQIIAKCPKCSTTAKLVAEAADRRIRCGQCGRLFKVPSLEEISAAVEVLQNSRGTIYVDEKGRIYG